MEKCNLTNSLPHFTDSQIKVPETGEDSCCYKGNKVAVGIPCYNEEVTIREVIENVRKYIPFAQIYVFDNNSSDNTYKIAMEALCNYPVDEGKRDCVKGGVLRVKNQGKGNVVLRFFADIEADLYVLIDGDSTYDCASIKKMIDKVLDEHLDMLVGRRIEVHEDPNNKTYRRGHRFGNIFLTNSISWIFDQKANKRNFRDMLSGFRVVSRRFAKSFVTLSTGFEIETQLNVHALQLKMPCGEINTPYFARPTGSCSKLSTYEDGFKILYTIFKLYSTEKPFFFYSSISLVLACISIILAIPIVSDYLATGLVPRLPTALLATGLMLSAIISFFSGLLLENVTKARLENQRASYLKYKAPWKK